MVAQLSRGGRSSRSRSASGILCTFAIALVVASPSTVVLVEAGFQAADLLNLVQILPTTCTTGTAVAAATTCFTTNAEACNCFDEAFVAPSMPSVLPTTCAEAGGDMTEVVCAMMECCPPCSEAVTGLWNCVADGTDTIDKDTCSVVCPADDGTGDSPNESPPPSDGTDESPSEGIDFPGFDDLPEGCEEAGQDLKACVEGLDEGVLGTAMTCMRNEASAKLGGEGVDGGLPTSKCGIIEAVTCAVRSCVPNSECLLQVMDAQNCAAGSDLGCDLNCDRGRDTDYATPPPSAGVGDGDLPMDDPFKLLAPECRPLAEEVGTCLKGLGEEGCEACVEAESEKAMKSLVGDLMKDDTSGVLGLIFGGLMEGMEGGAEGGGGTTPVAMGRMSENGEEGDEMMPMFDEGVLENFFCTMAGNVVCATRDCCPTCAARVDDVVACVKQTGGIEIPDLAAVMGDFATMNGGGTKDVPDRSVGGGEMMTAEEEPPTKMISCDISCDGAVEPKEGDESTTAATTAATASPQGGDGAATTAPPVDLDVAATTSTTEAPPGADGLNTRSGGGNTGRSAAVATAAATVGGLLLAAV